MLMETASEWLEWVRTKVHPSGEDEKKQVDEVQRNLSELLNRARLERQKLSHEDETHIAETHNLIIAAGILHLIKAEEWSKDEMCQNESGRELFSLATKTAALSKQLEMWKGRMGHQLKLLYHAIYEDARAPFIALVKHWALLKNERDIQVLQPADRKNLAQEAWQVFAPVAARLGVWCLVREIENKALEILYPDTYAKIEKCLQQQRGEDYQNRQKTICQDIGNVLNEAGLATNVQPWTPHIGGIHRRMQDGRELSDIAGQFYIHIVLEQPLQCYQAFGAIVAKWPGQLCDYIATPKPNGYRALHIYIDNQGVVKIKLQTHDMNLTAEWGIRAQGSPEFVAYGAKNAPTRVGWSENRAEDLGGYYIEEKEKKKFIFAPDGALMELRVSQPNKKEQTTPRSPTPVDFAHALHSDIGIKYIGAKVNFELVGPDYPLQNGDIVEIQVGHYPISPQVAARWLRFTETNKARSQIKHFIQQQKNEDVLMAYITLTASVDREARLLGINLSGPAVDTLLYEAARAFGYRDRDGLCKEVAKNFSLADKIALQALTDYLGYKVHLDAEDIRSLRLQANPIIRLAPCCRPTPNDQIYAIPHTSRVITVHKQDCKSASTSQRKVKAEWNRAHDVVPIAELLLEGWDRKGMLRDIAASLAAKDINIQSNSGQTYVGGTMAFRFTLELPNLSLLAELEEEIKKNVSGLTMVKLQSQIPLGRRGKIGVREISAMGGLNPYNYQMPVNDREMFFGREIIMDTLRDIVRGQTKSSAVVLCGPKRIGKSSVLNMLSQELEDDSTVIPILINWSGYTSVSLKEALTHIVHEISKKLFKIGKNLEDFRTETLATPRIWFLDLLSKALAMFPQKRFIFFMDEFGEVVCAQKAKALEQDFFGILSNVFFDHDKPVSFVFALPTTFTDQDMGAAFEGFVARMETPLHLSFLEENVARELIIEPSRHYASLDYDSEAVEEIIHITNRHPYYIHLICGKLVEKHPAQSFITKEDVQEVTQLITSDKTSSGDYQGCFNHFWKEWPLGSDVLFCLAEYETAGGTGATESSILKKIIRKGFQGKPDEIRACLTELKRRGAVIEADSKEPSYRLIPLLREWVYHHKSELIPMSNQILKEEV